MTICCDGYAEPLTFQGSISLGARSWQWSKQEENVESCGTLKTKNNNTVILKVPQIFSCCFCCKQFVWLLVVCLEGWRESPSFTCYLPF